MAHDIEERLSRSPLPCWDAGELFPEFADLNVCVWGLSPAAEADLRTLCSNWHNGQRILDQEQMLLRQFLHVLRTGPPPDGHPVFGRGMHDNQWLQRLLADQELGMRIGSGRISAVLEVSNQLSGYDLKARLGFTAAQKTDSDGNSSGSASKSSTASPAS